MSLFEEQPQRPPLFLEQQSYRRRRLADAARLLPVLGACLWLLPLMWWASGEPPESTARVAIYLFAVWAGLIFLALGLSIKLGAAEQGREDETGDDRE